MYYTSCGEFTYCYQKPDEHYSKCQGLSIVATCFMGLSMLSLFVLFVSICHFRRKAKQVEMKPHYQPLVFSSQEEWQRYQYLNSFHKGQNLQVNPNTQERFPLPLGDARDRYISHDKPANSENKMEAS